MIKEQTIGRNKVKTIEFGTGDIMLTTCRTELDRPLTLLWLSQHIAKPESDWDKNLIYPGTDSDQLPDNSIVLEFTKIKSIDQVIDALNDIKKSMQEGEKRNFKFPVDNGDSVDEANVANGTQQ